MDPDYIHKKLDKLLDRAKQAGYAGYSKFDAMNSPFLEKWFGAFSLTRLAAIQAVNRIPVNLRKVFGVTKGVNPKGVANFIKAYANLHEISPSPANEEQIRRLCAWLASKSAHHTGSYTGACWGYNFPWENPSFYAPRHFPNAIVTVFCAEAFLAAGKALKDESLKDTAKSAAKYLTSDLPILEETDTGKCLGYVTAPIHLKVININAVIAGFLSKMFQDTNDPAYLNQAQKLVNWVVSTQTPDHCWHYTHPGTIYVRNYDNYHTGGILDGIWDYLDALPQVDPKILAVFKSGLRFYETRLFLADGSPKWRSAKTWPKDIHGAAQGILTFSRVNPELLRNPRKADIIVRWTLDHMAAPHGGFYYQQYPFFTWRQEFMRWNNSWMAWALSEWLKNKKKRQE